jgi:hypothetical protein
MLLLAIRADIAVFVDQIKFFHVLLWFLPVNQWALKSFG